MTLAKDRKSFGNNCQQAFCQAQICIEDWRGQFRSQSCTPIHSADIFQIEQEA